ncbi:MAG: aldehyde dehydrogenase family protein, partial [Flavobacteriales bacterium]
MQFKSINPYNGEELATFTSLNTSELDAKLKKGEAVFAQWRKVPLTERCILLRKAGDVLLENVEEYAKMISLEMGKPINEARAEVRKCATVCTYYANNAASFLKDEIIETDASKSLVQHTPIGAVLAIMPWNFPFWQVMRFAAPTLTSGNVGLLKHAPNVFGSAKMIEEVFRKAGYPEGVFQNLIVHHDQTEKIIAHDSVKAVTLTGSERAGSAVASLAGKYIKKSVMELGGNNAFIVWEDADLNQTVKTAITARMINSGQSCIAAKRFILVGDIY